MMDVFRAVVLVIATLNGSATAATKVFTSRITYGGTIRLGSRQYSPVTSGYACRNSVSEWMLDCGDGLSGMQSMAGMSMGTYTTVNISFFVSASFMVVKGHEL